MMSVRQLVLAIFAATAVQQMAATTSTMKKMTSKSMKMSTTTTLGMQMSTTTMDMATTSTTTLMAMTSTMASSTTPLPAGAKKFAGAMTLQMADPAAFVADFAKAKTIMEHSIAASNADINQDMVDVSAVTLATRRLSAQPRVLAAGGVKVDYTIIFPPGASNPVFTAASVNTTALSAAVVTKSATLGLTVTVTGVVVAPPMVVGGTTVITTTQRVDLSSGVTASATASMGLLALLSAVVIAALAA